eukprot:jgi/Mesvir1/17080/Mv00982-RA.1
MDSSTKKKIALAAVIVSVICVFAFVLIVWLKDRQTSPRLVAPDRIDPNYQGFVMTPVAVMSDETFRRNILEFSRVWWKDAKTNSITTTPSDNPPQLRIIVMDGKIDVVQIINGPSDKYNNLSFQPAPLNMIRNMDIRFAVDTIAVANSPTWKVVNTAPLNLGGADENIVYVVLKHAETNQHRIVFYAAASPSEDL